MKHRSAPGLFGSLLFSMATFIACLGQQLAPDGSETWAQKTHLGQLGNIISGWHIQVMAIWATVKRRYERLQLRSAITTQNMWFTVCSDRGPYVAIPLFRLCLWLKLPVGRMTFQSFDVRVRHWSSRSGLVFLGSCKMACRQVYMR